MTAQPKTMDASLSIQLVAGAVTALFVPGDRPERFSKAVSAQPDVIIIDLEDAVPPGAKGAALSATLEALSTGTRLKSLVRINPFGTETTDAELGALLALAQQEDHGLLGIVVPKAEDTAALRELAGRCSALDLAVVPLVESAAGIVGAAGIAGISGVTRMAFGAIDYALDIDAGSDDRFVDYARSVLVVSSRAGAIPAPLDSPTTHIKENDKVRASAQLARGYGFGGKLCIHPSQIPVVKQAFQPDAEEVQWAEGVVSAVGGASQINGQMIDRPVIERAQRILARARKEN